MKNFISDIALLDRLETGSSYSYVFSVLPCGDVLIPQDVHLDIVFFLTNVGGEFAPFSFVLGNHASLKVSVVILGDGRSRFSFDMVSRHEGSGSSAHYSVRALLGDSSSLDCRGVIDIPQGSIGTSASFTSDALLLSSDASARAIPVLEIIEPDVKVSHSASVGRLDTEALFYLQSRGLSLDDARGLLLRGFIGGGLPSFCSDVLLEDADAFLKTVVS